MSFPFWNGQTPKHKIILEFFKYLRQELPDVKISADLFGLTTIINDDLGIGQVIEDAFLYFDYISPMVYPSHYQTKFLGYKNPAQYPYEVIKYSMDNAIARLITYNLQLTTTSTATIPTGSSVVSRQSLVKLRPWLQDFDLGADYNAEMVKKEIQAVYDSTSSTPQFINGWMLWSPSNVYTSGALQPN